MRPKVTTRAQPPNIRKQKSGKKHNPPYLPSASTSFAEVRIPVGNVSVHWVANVQINWQMDGLFAVDPRPRKHHARADNVRQIPLGKKRPFRYSLFTGLSIRNDLACGRYLLLCNLTSERRLHEVDLASAANCERVINYLDI